MGRFFDPFKDDVILFFPPSTEDDIDVDVVVDVVITFLPEETEINIDLLVHTL